MTDQTPLEKLADAIHEFFRSVDAPDGTFITGWALAYSTARIQADDDDALPMVDGARYVFGPETSVVQVAGLAKFLEVVAERAQWMMLDDDDGGS